MKQEVIIFPKTEAGKYCIPKFLIENRNDVYEVMAYLHTILEAMHVYMSRDTREDIDKIIETLRIVHRGIEALDTYYFKNLKKLNSSSKGKVPKCLICGGKRAPGTEREWFWKDNLTGEITSVGFLCVQCSPPGNFEQSFRVAEKYGDAEKYALTSMAHYEQKVPTIGLFIIEGLESEK